MTFIDTSFYLSLLNQHDTNHLEALKIIKQNLKIDHFVTSWAVIGEILTVGSMRFDKQTTLKFVEKLQNNPQTLILTEKTKLLTQTWKIFKQIKNKNLSWIDCYSAAIIDQYQIKQIFTFDQDFKKLQKKITQQFKIN